MRLSRYFLARSFLYSTIADFHGIQNIPDNPDLFIAAGEKLCGELLDPLVETFGPIEVRSAYRSPTVNDYGAKNDLGCASNEANRAGHIWDQRDANGHMGATASIVVPWFARRYEEGRDWADLAWWVHDHLPYAEMEFYPKLAAFNLSWHEATDPAASEPVHPQRIAAWMASPRVVHKQGDADRGTLEEGRERRYADFPPFRGLKDVLPY